MLLTIAVFLFIYLMLKIDSLNYYTTIFAPEE